MWESRSSLLHRSNGRKGAHRRIGKSLPKASRLGAFGRVTAYDEQAELYCEGSGYALYGPADVNGGTDATHGVPPAMEFRRLWIVARDVGLDMSECAR